MKIGVIGLNHKLANLGLRELLAKACQRRFSLANSFNNEHFFILLSTCNRTEIYFSSDDLAHTHSQLLQTLRDEVNDEFDQKIYSYFGSDCFLHLARVTAGLDSAIVAETEIQGQVKGAYEGASKYFTLPFELHFLFQKALNIGKKVRTEIVMGKGMPDLEHAIYNTGMHLFNNARDKKILFVGATDLNSKIISFLKSKQLHSITICNRSIERGQLLSERHQLALLEWNELHQWHNYDWIIFATKSPYPLVTPQNFPKTITSKKLIIDLSVPRNVDPAVGKNPYITLLNIDQMNRILKVRKQQMSEKLKEAEQFVSHAAQTNVSTFQEKTLRLKQTPLKQHTFFT